MMNKGVSEDIIVAKLKSDGLLDRPSADRIVELKKDGLSDRVIQAMIEAPRAVKVRYRRPVRVYTYSYPPVGHDPWWY